MLNFSTRTSSSLVLAALGLPAGPRLGLSNVSSLKSAKAKVAVMLHLRNRGGLFKADDNYFTSEIARTNK